MALALIVAGGAYSVFIADSGDDDDDVARAETVDTSAPPSTSAPVDSSVPETAEAPTTSESESTTAPVEADPSIADLQRRLAELGYDPGTPDGFLGVQTQYAISAFQRVDGLPATGEDSPALREALRTASRPVPLVPGGEANRVEVDLNRQVLFLWRGGALVRILPVSTGNGERYCVDGDCDTAITPTGMFRIGRKYPGLEVSRLGQLYHPMYFYGGIAIHGSPLVPPFPASHGCVRVPLYAAASLYDQVPSGMAVYVVGNGPSAASVPAPPDKPIEVHPPAPPPTEPERKPRPSTTTTTTTRTTTTTTTTTVPAQPERHDNTGPNPADFFDPRDMFPEDFFDPSAASPRIR